MKKDRFYYLVEQYHLAHERLNELRSRSARSQTIAEIFSMIEKDIQNEIRRSEEVNNTEMARYWQGVMELFFVSDQDRLTKEEEKEAQEKLPEDTQRHIVYYERKLKAIRKLLGDRPWQLLENFEEQNLLMGGGDASGGNAYRLMKKREQEEENRQNQKKGKFTFDKM